MTTATQTGSLISTLPGSYYTDPTDLRDGTGQGVRVDVVLRGSRRRSRQARRLQDGSGRQGKRAAHPFAQRRGAGLLQRLPPPRREVCAPKTAVKSSGRSNAPYHAWTYDLDGKLIAAPNLTKMPDIDRVEYGLRRVTCASGWATCGYAWPTTPPSPSRTPCAAKCSIGLATPEAIDHYGIAELSVGRRIRYDVKANWKLIIENFMECYHCATIHPELTEVLPEFADGLPRSTLWDTAPNSARTSKDSPSMAPRARPVAHHHRGPGPALLRDHGQPAGVHQSGARPRDPAPDVPDGSRPHDRRVRLALPARRRAVGQGHRPFGRAFPPGEPAGLRRV